jgi:hypothetical protein
MVTVAQAQCMVATAKRATYVALDATHAVLYTDPAQVATVLDAFLAAAAEPMAASTSTPAGEST